jgi:hypothetical protein
VLAWKRHPHIWGLRYRHIQDIFVADDLGDLLLLILAALNQQQGSSQLPISGQERRPRRIRSAVHELLAVGSIGGGHIRHVVGRKTKSLRSVLNSGHRLKSRFFPLQNNSFIRLSIESKICTIFLA